MSKSRSVFKMLAGLLFILGGGSCIFTGNLARSGSGDTGSSLLSWAILLFGFGLIALGIGNLVKSGVTLLELSTVATIPISETDDEVQIANSSRTYQHLMSTRLLFFFGACASGVLSIVIARDIGIVNTWFYVLLTILLAIGVVLTNEKIEINDIEIKSHQLGRRKVIQWEQIDKITNKANDLILYNAATLTSIRLSSQIDGYPEIVDWLRRRRPDLWVVTELKAFHQTNLDLLLYSSSALCLIVVGISILVAYQNLISLFPFAFAGWILSVIFTKAQQLILQGNHIVLKYPFRERQIMASEITTIQFVRVFAIFGGANYGVTIVLANHEIVTISGFKEGSPIIFNTLAMWWQKITSFQKH